MNDLEGIVKDVADILKKEVEKSCYNGNQSSKPCRSSSDNYIKWIDYLKREFYEIPSDYMILYNDLRHQRVIKK